MSGERCTRWTLSGDDIECKVAEYFRGGVVVTPAVAAGQTTGAKKWCKLFDEIRNVQSRRKAAFDRRLVSLGAIRCDIDSILVPGPFHPLANFAPPDYTRRTSPDVLWNRISCLPETVRPSPAPGLRSESVVERTVCRVERNTRETLSWLSVHLETALLCRGKKKEIFSATIRVTDFTKRKKGVLVANLPRIENLFEWDSRNF